MTFSLETELAHHEPWMLRLAQNIVHDQESARELVQDAFLRVLQSPPRGNASLRQWLWAVLQNRAIDQLRQEQKRPKKLALLGTETFEDSPGIEFFEAKQELYAQIQALPERQKKVILLRYIEGMGRKEVSRHLGISPQQVTIDQNEAILTLRNRLESRAKGLPLMGLAPLLWVMKPIKKLSTLVLVSMAALLGTVGLTFSGSVKASQELQTVQLEAPLEALQAREEVPEAPLERSQVVEAQEDVLVPEDLLDPNYTVSGTLTFNGEPAAGWTARLSNGSQALGRVNLNADGFWSFEAPDGEFLEIWLDHPSREFALILESQSEENLLLDREIVTREYTVPGAEGLTAVRQGEMIAYSTTPTIQFAPLGELEVVEVGEGSPLAWKVLGFEFNEASAGTGQ